jgi:putative ABC transport system ATP-binding protein
VADLAIKVEDVYKAYVSGSVVTWALRGVSLEVPRSSFIAIMGPSGSGKTTLLNMIGLLDRPTRGRIFIDGVDTTRLSDREHINLTHKHQLENSPRTGPR